AAFHDEADLARAGARRRDLAAAAAPLGTVIWFLPAPLSAPMSELLAAMARAVPFRAVVGVTGDHDADAAVWATCARVGVAPPAGRTHPTGDAPARAVTADTIVSVTDADEEVRAVVRRIAALAEAGVPLDRIGVFHPS